LLRAFKTPTHAIAADYDFLSEASSGTHTRFNINEAALSSCLPQSQAHRLTLLLEKKVRN